MTPAPTSSCDCCEGRRHITPESTANRPGFSEIAYRVGRHATFKETMLAAVAEFPALDGLTTRDDRDPSIGLIDSWATVLDVLTFYQERIANEGYLATATESLSIRELAAALGYRPVPAVAAETHLAFEMETAPGAPAELTIESGTKVQSLPGPGEKPQLFETTDDVDARPEWNAMRPRQSVAGVSGADTAAHLDGVATRIAVGDGLLFVGAGREDDAASTEWDFRVVTDVLATGGVVRVSWTEPLEGTPASSVVTVYAFRSRAAVFGHNAPDSRLLPDEVRSQFSLSMCEDWEFVLSRGAAGSIDLDRVYEGVVNDSWVVLSADDVEPYRVTDVVQAAREDYTLVGKVSRLALSGVDLDSLFGGKVRQTTVYAVSEPLAVGARPETSPVQGASILLDTQVPTLGGDRSVLVTGRRAVLTVDVGVHDLLLVPRDGGEHVALEPGDELIVQAPASDQDPTTWTVVGPDGVVGTVAAPDGGLVDAPASDAIEAVAERAVLDSATLQDDVTRLDLTAPLAHAYDRGSCRIMANVVHATHGETKREVLGSGDAALGRQRFSLRERPLTHVPAPNPEGYETTLTVRVNGQAWEQAETLYQAGERARVYAVTESDEGTVTVTFGDGVEGARVATGTENVTAEYRVGAGRDGMVSAGQLSLLMTRPLGLKGVVNPLPPDGGADGEAGEEIRTNAPHTVLAFDRIVSATDYEDVARQFPGVAKARAAELWDASERIVHITIAGVDGEAVGVGTTVHTNLSSALRNAGGVRQRFRVDTYEPLMFDIDAGLFVDPAYDPDVVHGQAVDELTTRYAFAQRALAQPVTVAEVFATLQRVTGVTGVDVNVLDVVDGQQVHDLTAQPARPRRGGIAPAQLLMLNTDGVNLVMLP